MADNIAVTPGAGATVATDDIGGVQFQRIKLTWGVDGSAVDASATNPLPVTGPLTDTQLRAAAVPVSGTFWQATQPVSGTVGVSGSVAVTGTFWQATQPVSLASLPALPAGTNNIGDVDVLTINGVAPAFGSGVRGATVQRVTIATDDVVPVSQSGTWNIGTVTTLPALVASSAVIGKVGIDQTTDGTTNRVNAVPGSTAHALIPAPSTYRLLSAAATTNGANIKSSAGTIKGIQGFNAKASAVYLKLYNKASAPTVGTDTPVKTIYLPASAAFAFDFGTGVAFATGISIALTGAGADADTTALASGDILALNVDYH